MSFPKPILIARCAFVLAATVLASVIAHAEASLAPDLRANIDNLVQQVLTKTAVPSASVAVVQNGQIVYVHAYGYARLAPRLPARAEMRYSVGSISKQFTATAILMLAEEGKLSLDDPVGRFVPDLTRANEVTIRELLSHTSGYQDYWPQDYVPPFMVQPITAQKILDIWAKKPLDFDPGTKWQYSNTNYVIAGVIAEKAGGMPLLDFLRKRIFTPLKMESVANIDQNKLGDTDPTGYMRYALGPLHPAPKEGRGWLFAAGELAMPVGDLAKWDIGLMNEALMKPESYKQMESEVRLKNGDGTKYGLGLDVTMEGGHRVLEHTGEVSGFTADNIVYPDDKVAVAVLTNQDAATTASQIGRKIAPLLLPEDAGGLAKLKQVRSIFDGLQHGKIDRALFTEDANAYFSEQALKDFAASLGPLGTPQEFVQTNQEGRGGMMMLTYRAKFPTRTLDVWIYQMPDGKYEEYQVMPRE